MQELIDRVQAAEKGDSALNDDIARFLGWTQHSDEADPVYKSGPQLWWAEPGEEWSTCSWPPNYTGSVDAALTLIPEGFDYVLGHTNGGLTIHAEVGGRGDDFMQFGATPALALCAAALKARLVA